MMITMKHKLRGWVDRTKIEISLIKCPNCGELKTSISMINKNEAKCLKCENNFILKDNIIKVRENALKCDCGEEVPLIKENRSYLQCYVCPNCENILAIIYDNQLITPSKIISPEWLKSESNSTHNIHNQLYAIDCESKKSLIVFNIIHHLVVLPEGHNFTSFKPSTQNGILFFDKKHEEYVGCIVWSDDKEEKMNILRQIFVFKNRRDQGYGTLMMKYWIDNYGLKENPIFGIESPTGNTINILIRLKYAEMKNDKLEKYNWRLIYNG